jgi:hypothetical protein
VQTRGAALNYVALPLFFLGVFPLLASAGPKKGPLLIFSYGSVLAGLLLGAFFLIVFRVMVMPRALGLSTNLVKQQARQDEAAGREIERDRD